MACSNSERVLRACSLILMRTTTSMPNPNFLASTTATVRLIIPVFSKLLILRQTGDWEEPIRWAISPEERDASVCSNSRICFSISSSFCIFYSVLWQYSAYSIRVQGDCRANRIDFAGNSLYFAPHYRIAGD
ncbi:hypothetical protein MNBD_ALPHA11-1912 [hydrothermal vent metagenome]|uniref:Uncharacterized protein n=1 Tax=hydrothermal vent metagenome TaxID=652676 RepID=A0A3B0TZD4_9ZZZZ